MTAGGPGGTAGDRGAPAPRPARPLLGPDELRQTVHRLGRDLSSAYPNGVVLVGVLKGSVVFLADLIRAMTVPVAVDFLAISAYAGGTARVRILQDLELDIAGRPVVLVEDLVDTGLTVTYLLGHLGRRDPASLEVCTLIDKTARRIVPVPLRFVGVEMGDEFVLGYGIDWAGRYRNLDQLVAGELESLRSDPDAHVQQLYSG